MGRSKNDRNLNLLQVDPLVVVPTRANNRQILFISAGAVNLAGIRKCMNLHQHQLTAVFLIVVLHVFDAQCH